MRFVASKVTIPLDPDVAVWTQAAYPRLIACRISTRPKNWSCLYYTLLRAGFSMQSHIAMAYGSLLHYLFTFATPSLKSKITIERRQGSLFSVALSFPRQFP